MAPLRTFKDYEMGWVPPRNRCHPAGSRRCQAPGWHPSPQGGTPAPAMSLTICSAFANLAVI